METSSGAFCSAEENPALRIRAAAITANENTPVTAKAFFDIFDPPVPKNSSLKEFARKG
jgi:hypothetical protein